MPAYSISTILQIVVALGLLNVWVMRKGSATSYRGGEAQTLKEEFAAYGLPPILFYVVGALKIGSAISLIAGIWDERLVFPAAALVALLMVAALVMHLKVKDPAVKSLPALVMLIMSVTLCALALS